MRAASLSRRSCQHPAVLRWAMAVALFLLPAAPDAAQAGIVLVEDGSPRCAIVLPDDPNRYDKIGDLDRMDEEHDFLSLGWAKHNEGRAALTDGTEGDLVAMLPDEWSFTTDPRNLGVIKRWYALKAAPRNWRKIRVSRIWEVQGLEDERGRGYDGAAWYFTRVKVPAAFAGRKIHLNFGGVFGKMLIWANGEFGHYRPWTGPWWQNVMNTAFDADLTDVLEPGQVNTIAIRVDNEFEWGGLFRRIFLYSPVAQ